MPVSLTEAEFSKHVGSKFLLKLEQPGGDGKSTFALPNFEGSAVVGTGQGPSLTEYFEGEIGITT